MRITCQLLAAAAALLLTTASLAAPVSYTNVDVGIVTTELNNSSLDGDGLLLRGSFAVHKSAFVFAQLQDIGYGHGIDGISWGVGAGGHVPITNEMDLVGKLAVVHQSVDGRDGENGFQFAGTVRGFIVDRLELEGGIKHVHFADSGNDTSLIGEGRYFFTKNIAGGVLLQLGDTTSFGVFGRFDF
jgi:hypothetical protein